MARGLTGTGACPISCVNDEPAGGRRQGARRAGGDPLARRSRLVGRVDGFDLDAGLRIAQGDDVGRETLAHYCLRPPFARDRFARLPDGRIAYTVKAPRGRRAARIVLEPLACLARLAALLPPPRWPLVRYHGALAARSRLRARIVPRPRAPAGEGAGAAGARDCHREAPRVPAARLRARGLGPPNVRPKRAAARAAVAVYDDPPMITLAHHARLRDGALYAHTARLDWAKLLRRALDVDALECPRCHARLRVVGAIRDRAGIDRMLAHVGRALARPP